VELFFEVAREIPRRVILVADASYASGKVIRPLLAQGCQRARSSSAMCAS